MIRAIKVSESRVELREVRYVTDLSKYLKEREKRRLGMCSPVTQFRVSRFQGHWWWFIYTRDAQGLETVTRKGKARSENMCLLCGLIAWARHNLARRG